MGQGAGLPIELSISASNYNTYNISCFGKKDGSINLTVTGGTAPFTYLWSNDATTEDLAALPSGYYRVTVRDANSMEAEAQITLTEPEQLNADELLSNYPNGFNISCNSCFNGNIILYAVGGVAPYSFEWEDGPTSYDRFNLGAGTYNVIIMDANQCIYNPRAYAITEPERSDWTVFGNTGSDPATDFIGTADNKDVVFKTDNSERLRIKNTGEIKLNGLIPGMIYLDSDGILKSSDPGPSPNPCSQVNPLVPKWNTTSTFEIYTCPPFNVGIGTYDIPPSVRLKVQGTSWFEGDVSIGMNPLDITLATGTTPYKLLVNGKLGATEIYCAVGNPWPDYVFESNYKKASFSELANFIRNNKHLPEGPNATTLAQEGINVSEMLGKAYEKIEELYLYVLELEKRVGELEK